MEVRLVPAAVHAQRSVEIHVRLAVLPSVKADGRPVLADGAVLARLADRLRLLAHAATADV